MSITSIWHQYKYLRTFGLQLSLLFHYNIYQSWGNLGNNGLWLLCAEHEIPASYHCRKRYFMESGWYLSIETFIFVLWVRQAVPKRSYHLVAVDSPAFRRHYLVYFNFKLLCSIEPIRPLEPRYRMSPIHMSSRLMGETAASKTFVTSIQAAVRAR